jgi:WD40 repeat protein
VKEVSLVVLPLLVPICYLGQQLLVPQPVLTIRSKEPVTAVAISPNGKTIAIGSNGLSLWDAETGTIQKTLTESGYADSIAFSPNGRFLVTGSHGMGTGSTAGFVVWDVDAGRVLWSKAYTQGSVSAIFSPDAKTVASNHGAASGRVQLWNASTGVLRQTLTDMAHKRASMAFSPDGDFVAAQVNERRGIEGVKLWSAQTRKLIGVIHLKGLAGWPLAFSPDSKSIAVTSLTGQGTQTLALISVATKKVIWKWQTSARTVSLGAVVFSPNGKLLFCDCPHLGVMIFDAQTGKHLKTFKAKENHWGGGASSLAVSPDSRSLITKDGHSVKVWDISNLNRSN